MQCMETGQSAGRKDGAVSERKKDGTLIGYIVRLGGHEIADGIKTSRERRAKKRDEGSNQACSEINRNIYAERYMYT